MNQPEPEVGEVAATTFKAMLDRGDPLAVLDVREDHERDYAAIPLPGTAVDLHVPLNSIPSRLREITDASTGRKLVVYCHHGQRSMMAATWLAHQGIADVHNLDGGIEAWSVRVDRGIKRY